MKKALMPIAMLLLPVAVSAQITVDEPEFAGSYYLLTCDSGYVELPKESGTLKNHENKVSRWSRLVSGGSRVASAAGLVGVAAGGPASSVLSSAKVVTTASSLSSAASTVGTLAGAAGKDIVFAGKASEYTADLSDGDLRVIVRADGNDVNPVDIYRVVRFSSSKKERRVRWYDYSPSLLGSSEAAENGYVNFSGEKYGDRSYLLTIPASELSSGQFGIFVLGVETALAIPVATFGVD